MAIVLVEQIFDPPMTEEQWNQGLEMVLPCFQAHDAHWIRSCIARDRRSSICEFESPDAESVRRSFRKVDIPFVRIWTVDVLEPTISQDCNRIVAKGW